MKDNNEPKPGYLGQNLKGHKEPVPEMAWEGIEARLNRKKRRGLFFWIFGALGLILIGFGWWEMSRNSSELEVPSTQIVNNQHQEVIPKENSQSEKLVEKEKDQSPESRTESGTKEDIATNSSSNGHTKKEEVLKESTNQKQPASGQKATKEFVFSKADQKGRQAVSVFTSEDALPGTSHTEIGPIAASGKEPKKEIQKDFQPERPISNSPEPEELAGQVSSRTSSSTESNTEISSKTEVLQQKPNVVLTENQENQNSTQSNLLHNQVTPSDVNAVPDSIPKQVAKTAANPDSQAVSKTDSTQPQKRKKQANWMLSFHAGLMQQSASLQQDYFTNEGLPMVSISPENVSKAPSFRLAMSRLWQ